MTEENSPILSNEQESSYDCKVLTPLEFKKLVADYGLGGDGQSNRIDALKVMGADKLAFFITDLNRRLLGQDETLVNETTMKVGDRRVVPFENRYELFSGLFNKIATSDNDINPDRLADVLCLGVVLLHPFKDGNGRTSRALRLIFDSSYDYEEFERSFYALTESRDISRARGGSIILGYVPRFEDGQDQSDPATVQKYIDRLLNEENEYLYTGPYGYAHLRSNYSEAS